MRKHACSRCRTEQVIPTHQIVKFDTTVQPLCRDCWEGFRAWFFAGDRIIRLDPITNGDSPRAA
jgi:hypothetical protein